MLNESEAHGLKAMFYCHDTYGLGHIRRTLTLAHHFRAIKPGISQLIMSGSPVATTFAYPAESDVIKLPSVTKTAAGDYTSRSLAHISFDALRDMRRDLILAAAKQYHPDFFFVDHAPTGLRGEVVDTLKYLKHELPDTRLVIGLRDVMDEGPKVRNAWKKEGAYELFDDLYDMIFVYGHRNFYDVVEEYGLSEKAAAKTRFVGYLKREAGQKSPQEVRESIEMQTDKLVLVTAGGGADGEALFQATVRDLEMSEQHDFDTLLVGGPLLSNATRDRIRERLGDRGNVHFLDFTDDMPAYIGAADAVISMGGYNTVCETMSLHRPTLIVPRVHPRKEQLIRASFLNKHGFVDMLHPQELEPGALLKMAFDMLDHGDQVPELPMEGLTNLVTSLEEARARQLMDRSA
jgi:predicted glycosyltransferase